MKIPGNVTSPVFTITINKYRVGRIHEKTFNMSFPRRTICHGWQGRCSTRTMKSRQGCQKESGGEGRTGTRILSGEQNFRRAPGQRMSGLVLNNIYDFTAGMPGRIWRRGWDLNPRRSRLLAGFQDRCIQPLCHLSGVILYLFSMTYGVAYFI